MRYIYLHGFASSPNSIKAKFFKPKLAALGYELTLPDFNQPDFTNLTLSRQIQQVANQLTKQPTTLIGSSFGSLTALWLAEKNPCIQRLVLLAPAVGFLHHCLPKLGDLTHWQQQQQVPVYHHAAQTEKMIDYRFVDDLTNYPDTGLQRQLATLIFHGKDDEVIPLTICQAFVKQRPWIQLTELNSDHALNDCLPQIWLQTKKFCHL